MGMIKCFVAAGLVVSLISSSFARNEVRAGEAKLIPIADMELYRELGLVYRRDRTLPRSSAAFIYDGAATSRGKSRIGTYPLQVRTANFSWPSGRAIQSIRVQGTLEVSSAFVDRRY